MPVNATMKKDEILEAAKGYETEIEELQAQVAELQSGDACDHCPAGELNSYVDELSANLDSAREENQALQTRVKDLEADAVELEASGVEHVREWRDRVEAAEARVAELEKEPEADTAEEHPHLSAELQAVIRSVNTYAVRRNVNVLRGAEANLRRAIVAAQ